MTSLKSNDLPEAPCPNTVTLGVRASTYEFEGAWNIHLQFIIKCGNFWVVKFWMIFTFFILCKFGGHSILKIHGPVMSLNTCLFPVSFLISVILESTYLSICPPFLNCFHIMSSWRVENLMNSALSLALALDLTYQWQLVNTRMILMCLLLNSWSHFSVREENVLESYI